MARRRPVGRALHLAALPALQRAHPHRRRGGGGCRDGRGFRAHRGRARRHHPDLLRIQHAGGAAALCGSAASSVALLEVGLGGRLDATNLVDADVAVVCSVGLDHRDWLGETLEEIGAEKAGIFRSAPPRGAGHGEHAGERVRRDRAPRREADRGGAGLRLARDGGRRRAAALELSRSRLSLADLPPSALAGSIQYRNAATALAALEALAVGAGRPPRRRRSSRRSMRGPPRPGCAGYGSRGACRSCPGRWSGSSTSRTTRRPPRCWPRSSRSGRVRDARWPSSAFSVTRMRRRSRARSRRAIRSLVPLQPGRPARPLRSGARGPPRPGRARPDARRLRARGCEAARARRASR